MVSRREQLRLRLMSLSIAKKTDDFSTSVEPGPSIERRSLGITDEDTSTKDDSPGTKDEPSVTSDTEPIEKGGILGDAIRNGLKENGEFEGAHNFSNREDVESGSSTDDETHEADDLSKSELDFRDIFAGYRIRETGDPFQVNKDQYTDDKRAITRGTANPSLMEKPFWKYMINSGPLTALGARMLFKDCADADMRSPVWTFRRYGATSTKLPDGRIVCIGGGHESAQSPEFCIYNDVIVFLKPVLKPDGSTRRPLFAPDCIKIYGYPLKVFPATDYHTATYFKNHTTEKEYIFIVGGFGYPLSASRHGTHIYRLDLYDYSIKRVKPGLGPIGPIHEHKTELIGGQELPALNISTKDGQIYYWALDV